MARGGMLDRACASLLAGGGRPIRRNKRIVLKERPEGHIDAKLPGTFEVNVETLKDLPDGHILVKTNYLSIDPAMRGWLRDARSYLPPVQIGEVMRAGGVGTVVASKVSGVEVGTHVSALTGWQEYAVLKKGSYSTIEKGSDPVAHLGVLGSSGQTAYWGLFDVGKPKKGDVVVVTGAAGSVGSLVVQMAKLKGCTVIGVAGGAEKCKWVESLGADQCLDYKTEGFTSKFKSAIRKAGYLDVMFDNVGGEQLDAALLCLKQHARIVLCGAISDYNATEVRGLKNYQTLIAMRGVLQGFIVFDYAKRYAESAKQMSAWISEGKLRPQTTVEEGGLEACPTALRGLFEGKNRGKQVVKVA